MAGRAAAIGSPPAYAISHVRDFLAVPEDRIEACLKDFQEALNLARAFKALADIAADLTGEDKNLNSWNTFTWTDDGKKAATITMRAAENTEAEPQP